MKPFQRLRIPKAILKFRNRHPEPAEIPQNSKGIDIHHCSVFGFERFISAFLLSLMGWLCGGSVICLTGNSATTNGGGTAFATLNNCIVYFNSASDGANDYASTLHYSCIFPLPPTGAGNITNAPLFVDYASGNLRLQSNSPCINAGDISIVIDTSTDLDGDPRIVAVTVDIGAYEFQSPASIISYAWLQQYGLPINGSADTVDSDGDLLNNWQEWRCQTDPTKALSVLRGLEASPAGNDVNVSWRSVAGVSYLVERSTNLVASPAFLPLATNVIGQAGTTTFTDTNAPPAVPLFYRVGVATP